MRDEAADAGKRQEGGGQRSNSGKEEVAGRGSPLPAKRAERIAPAIPRRLAGEEAPAPTKRRPRPSSYEAAAGRFSPSPVPGVGCGEGIPPPREMGGENRASDSPPPGWGRSARSNEKTPETIVVRSRRRALLTQPSPRVGCGEGIPPPREMGGENRASDSTPPGWGRSARSNEKTPETIVVRSRRRALLTQPSPRGGVRGGDPPSPRNGRRESRQRFPAAWLGKKRPLQRKDARDHRRTKPPQGASHPAQPQGWGAGRGSPPPREIGGENRASDSPPPGWGRSARSNEKTPETIVVRSRRRALLTQPSQ